MNGNNNARPVICPRDPIWLKRMLEVLPVGLRGKLAPFAGCVESSKPSKGSEVIRPVLVKR